MKRKKTKQRQRPAGELLVEAVGLQERGAVVEAEQRYREVLAQEPDNHTALNLLAMIVGERDPAEAVALITRAIAAAPEAAWSHMNLGYAYAVAGHDELAVQAMQTSARLDPGNALPHYDLARHHLGRGRRDEALAALREVLARDPAHERARFLEASLSGAHVDRPPAAYVTELFDSYAPMFEDHLVNELEYKVPARLAELVGAVDPPARAWQVIDVGCGSGLGGVAFREFARQLIGSDLSPRMIELSRARGVYDELYVEDLVATLGRAAGADLVVAADVFIYVGALDEAFAATARALRPGGLFAFSAERCDGDRDGFRLLPSSRYEHGDGYIRGLAERHGFAVREARDTVIRLERTEPVPGVLYLLAAAAAPPQ